MNIFCHKIILPTNTVRASQKQDPGIWDTNLKTLSNFQNLNIENQLKRLPASADCDRVKIKSIPNILTNDLSIL
jgi:hypothetical protein